MSSIAFSSNFLLLIAGIVLTAITMIQMFSGKLRLPGWGKILLSAAMIGMLVVNLISILPPLKMENPLVDTKTHVVTPASPTETLPLD